MKSGQFLKLEPGAYICYSGIGSFIFTIFERRTKSYLAICTVSVSYEQAKDVWTMWVSPPGVPGGIRSRIEPSSIRIGAQIHHAHSDLTFRVTENLRASSKPRIIATCLKEISFKDYANWH